MKFEFCRHTFALQKIGAVAASHRDTAEALGETSGRVKELQVLKFFFEALSLIDRVKELINSNEINQAITLLDRCNMELDSFLNDLKRFGRLCFFGQ